jgi:hypothetical protein
MCELLTGGSRLCGGCARSSEVGEFVCGLCMLVFEVLCNGACWMDKRQQRSNGEAIDALDELYGLDPYRWLYFG